MKKIRVLKGILARTHAANMLAGYFMFVLVAAGIITAAEPEITSYGEALWYCYAVISTAGFGDVVAATVIGKVVSVILTVYSVFVIALVTGVVVNYYNQIISLQQEETISAFMDKLERLPELSREELEQMSRRASLLRPEWDKKKNKEKKTGRKKAK